MGKLNPNTKGLIMVVDDEVDTREILGSMLEKLNYDYMLVKDGNDAIQKYESLRESIDLVMLDIFIPKMGGKEIYEKLSKINPDVNVLAISGYGEETEEVKSLLNILNTKKTDFILKPFDLEILDQKIDSIMEKRETAAHT